MDRKLSKNGQKRGKKGVKMTYFGKNGSKTGPKKGPVFGPIIKCISTLINARNYFLTHNFQDRKKVKKHEKVEKTHIFTKKP